MFDSKEIAQKALSRAESIRQKRAAGKKNIYAAAFAAACLTVLVGLAFFLPAAPSGLTVDSPPAVSAALLASAGAGGYILMGVVGFVLGAVTVLFSYKRSKRN